MKVFLPAAKAYLPAAKAILSRARVILPAAKDLHPDEKDVLPDEKGFLPDRKDGLPGEKDLLSVEKECLRDRKVILFRVLGRVLGRSVMVGRVAAGRAAVFLDLIRKIGVASGDRMFVAEAAALVSRSWAGQTGASAMNRR